jgi:hypothetical protein
MIAVLLLCGLLSAANAAKLYRLGNPEARCLDGTLGGYYMSVPSLKYTNRYVIHLQAGGECADDLACQFLTDTPFGSSKFYPTNMPLISPILSENCTINPDFCEWIHIMVPDCSQDFFSGQRTSASPDTFGLYFSGAKIFESVIDDLAANQQLNLATNIVLSGEGAGGVATWLHVDALAKRFPSARVVGVSIAGFYFYQFKYYGEGHVKSFLVDYSPSSWPRLYTLWNATVDETCKTFLHETPWACMLANYSMPYINSGMFIVQSQTDNLVLLGHNGVPLTLQPKKPVYQYITEWSTNMSIALSPAVESPNRGVFSAACFIHRDFNAGSPLIDNMNFLEVLGNWYYGRSGEHNAVDDCGIFCNPTCEQPLALIKVRVL